MIQLVLVLRDWGAWCVGKHGTRALDSYKSWDLRLYPRHFRTQNFFFFFFFKTFTPSSRYQLPPTFFLSPENKSPTHTYIHTRCRQNTIASLLLRCTASLCVRLSHGSTSATSTALRPLRSASSSRRTSRSATRAASTTSWAAPRRCLRSTTTPTLSSPRNDPVVPSTSGTCSLHRKSVSWATLPAPPLAAAAIADAEPDCLKDSNYSDC